MFLFVFEDGSIQKADTHTDEDLEACDAGNLDLIDITDPLEPMRYFDGEWLPIEMVHS